MKVSADIDNETVRKFIDNLSLNDSKRISSYLIHLLYCSEEDEKASIMGTIYKARILGEIDNDTMLRLCSIVNNSFLIDLKKLPFYIEKSNKGSIEVSNFINLGLVDNFVGGHWVDEPTWVLNGIGKTLHNILKSDGWFDK